MPAAIFLCWLYSSKKWNRQISKSPFLYTAFSYIDERKRRKKNPVGQYGIGIWIIIPVLFYILISAIIIRDITVGDYELTPLWWLYIGIITLPLLIIILSIIIRYYTQEDNAFRYKSFPPKSGNRPIFELLHEKPNLDDISATHDYREVIKICEDEYNKLLLIRDDIRSEDDNKEIIRLILEVEQRLRRWQPLMNKSEIISLKGHRRRAYKNIKNVRKAMQQYRPVTDMPNVEDFNLSELKYFVLKHKDEQDYNVMFPIIEKYEQSHRRKIIVILSVLFTIVSSGTTLYFAPKSYAIISIVLFWIFPLFWLFYYLFKWLSTIFFENDSIEYKKIIVNNYIHRHISDKDIRNYNNYLYQLHQFYAIPTEVDWKDIIIKDNVLLIIVKKFENEYTYKYNGVISLYDDYKIVVLQDLKKVMLHLENGELCIDNMPDLIYSIDIIKKRYMADVQVIDRHNHSISQQVIRSRILNQRSPEYLNYLLERQIKGIGVIETWESVIHSNTSIYDNPKDRAYIFTLLSSRTDHHFIVVYENVNLDRASASILLTVSVKEYSDYITQLIKYMSGSVVNKRSRLHENRSIGVGHIIRHAYHGDFEKWRNQIEGISTKTRIYKQITYRKTTSTRKKKRRWKRWY